MLKALARQRRSDGDTFGILPAALARTNSRHTPVWGVLLFMVVSALLTVAAGGRDQELVLFYAVSVFLSFLAGLSAMAVFSYREQRRTLLVINLLAATGVAFTLLVNLSRGGPLVSLAAALLIAAGLYWLWVRSGRPRGIRDASAESG